jgi:hypothetical protein
MKKILIFITLAIVSFSCGKKGPPGCEIIKENKEKNIVRPNFCN